jgi:hypothetical protein
MSLAVAVAAAVVVAVVEVRQAQRIPNSMLHRLGLVPRPKVPRLPMNRKVDLMMTKVPKGIGCSRPRKAVAGAVLVTDADAVAVEAVAECWVESNWT